MTRSRILLGATFAACASGAFAQTTSAAASVLEAFAELRQAPALALRQESEETYLGRTVRTVATAKWVNANENGRDIVRAEFTVSRDGTLVQRVVLDGRTVWNVDVRANRYSATPVDRASGTQANTYRTSLETALDEAIGGPAADLVRLTREIEGSTAPTHRAWIPGVAPVAGQEPTQSRWAVYDLPSGQPKNVTFELSEVDGLARFDRFHRTGTVVVQGEPRAIETVITLDPEPVDAASPAFVFVPPADARPVPSRAVRF